MKVFILFICALSLVLALNGPEPPMWPSTFSQDFVQTDSRAKTYVSGKLWYDDANSRMRFDFSGSNYQELCYKFSQDNSTSCSIIADKGALYVNLPQKSKCCACCNKGDKCDIIRRDWLQDFKYAGEATLSGQSFYKWTYNFSSTQSESYYATEDEERVPRRID